MQVAGVDDYNSRGMESLLNLVEPELGSLIDCWLAALRDSALLSLPPEFKSQLPPKGGTYYTAECADVSLEILYVNCF